MSPWIHSYHSSPSLLWTCLRPQQSCPMTSLNMQHLQWRLPVTWHAPVKSESMAQDFPHPTSAQGCNTSEITASMKSPSHLHGYFRRFFKMEVHSLNHTKSEDRKLNPPTRVGVPGILILCKVQNVYKKNCYITAQNPKSKIHQNLKSSPKSENLDHWGPHKVNRTTFRGSLLGVSHVELDYFWWCWITFSGAQVELD